MSLRDRILWDEEQHWAGEEFILRDDAWEDKQFI